MLEFYFMPDDLRVAVIILGTISVISMTLALVLAVHCLHKNRARIFKTVLIFLALCQSFICCALIAQVQYNATAGYIIASDYVISRYILFGIIFIFSTGLTAKGIHAKEKSFFPPITATVAAALTLPVTEALTGEVFPFLYVAALIIWLISGVKLSFMYTKEVQTKISGLSIKQAIDSLDTAVLVYKKNGQILLLNHAMQELMIKTSGRVFRSGTKYMETQGDGSVVSIYGHDRTAPPCSWLFSVAEIENRIIQVTATDVTEHERANDLLRETRARLERRNVQLRSVIENIEEIRQTEELIRLKSQIHDLMGQKLTVLMTSLRQARWPEDDTLASIAADLLDDIKHADESALDPQVEINTMTRAFEQIGGRIEITGDLPEDKDVALVFAQILREAAVNAVIHGYAHAVYAEITQNGNETKMRITDDNANPPAQITEGSGITDMRRRLNRIGGVLEIKLQPRFMLTVDVHVG